jgi:glycerol-3-phosphate dehydrogenase subunit C
MVKNKSERTIRSVLDACADCDTCRFLMDESCLLFPRLYRLYDQEKETGKPVGTDELRKLVELCTLCGLCPCPNIQADVIRGKTERVQEDGMPLPIRLLADVQRFGRWGSLFPNVMNRAFLFSPVGFAAKKSLGFIRSATCLNWPKKISSSGHAREDSIAV